MRLGILGRVISAAILLTLLTVTNGDKTAKSEQSNLAISHSTSTLVADGGAPLPIPKPPKNPRSGKAV
jgi:hypothetical protein